MSDILERIDTAVADWEAQPQAWNPGDPLYEDPRERARRGDDDGHVVRPMIQIIERDDRRINAIERHLRCRPCGVSWAGIYPCWVCGEHRPPVGAPSYAGSEDAQQLLVNITVVTTVADPAAPTVAELEAGFTFPGPLTFTPETPVAAIDPADEDDPPTVLVFDPRTNCISPLRPAEPHEGDPHP